MNLIELGQKWIDKELTDKEVVNEASKIEIFKPIKSDDLSEDTSWQNGNGNSWLEVNDEFLDGTKMTEKQYEKFVRLVTKGQSLKN